MTPREERKRSFDLVEQALDQPVDDDEVLKVYPEEAVLTRRSSAHVVKLRLVSSDDFDRPHLELVREGKQNLAPNPQTGEPVVIDPYRVRFDFDDPIARWVQSDTGVAFAREEIARLVRELLARR